MTGATRADRAVERGSEGLHALAQKAADRGGLAGKLAAPFEEDAQFVLKLKPSLVAARIRGQAPRNGQPEPVEPPRPRKGDDGSGGSGAGPNPFVLVGAAAFAGVMLAKLIDWRGHAHPRL